MATYTVYPSHDGRIQSTSASYSNARSGSGSTLQTDASNSQGIGQYLQSYTYYCFERFETYTISALGLSNVGITGAILCHTLSSNYTATDSTVNARQSTYSDTAFSTSDWVAADNSSSATLLATLNTVNLPAYNGTSFTYTSTEALNTYIQQQLSGKVKVMYVTDRFENGNVPYGDEDYYVRDSSYSGTVYDPYLYFETIPASAKTGSFTANAFIKSAISGSFTADGQVLKNGFYLNATIKNNGVTRAIWANAYIGQTSRRTVTTSSVTGTAIVDVFRSSPDSIRKIKIYRRKPVH